jgi:hypothetical protein
VSDRSAHLSRIVDSPYGGPVERAWKRGKIGRDRGAIDTAPQRHTVVARDR